MQISCIMSLYKDMLDYTVTYGYICLHIIAKGYWIVDGCVGLYGYIWLHIY